MLLARLLTLLAATLVMLLIGEAVVRWLDGYALSHPRLERVAVASTSRTRLALVERHLANLADVPEIEPQWFALDPPPLVGRETPAELTRLAGEIRDLQIQREFLRVYNRKAADRIFCDWFRTTVEEFPGFAFVYDPADGLGYPTFRNYPSITTPLGLVTNRWGWRGRDIEVDKPPGTIRIAFIGGSTTINGHGFPHSYPEYIEHWLNLWARARELPVRFESLNLGRSGANSADLVAVVKQELLPVEPDLALYYEGANHFKSVRFSIESSDASGLQGPTGVAMMREAAAGARQGVRDYSALIGRLAYNLAAFTQASGRELPRPDYSVTWPEGLDEQDPDLDRRDLPLLLFMQLENIEAIRSALDRIGAELVLSSFVWLVADGLVLDPLRHEYLYQHLNGPYWPLSYKDHRRFLDFQNRVYRRYAASRGLAFIDMATLFPDDPDLFVDGMHRVDAGVRLHAWLTFRELLPVIRERIRTGALPRPDREPQHSPPGFPMEITRMPVECPSPSSARGGSAVDGSWSAPLSLPVPSAS